MKNSDKVPVWAGGKVQHITLPEFDRMLHEGEIEYNHIREGWSTTGSDEGDLSLMLVLSMLLTWMGTAVYAILNSIG